jgi:hypothetical protein
MLRHEARFPAAFANIIYSERLLQETGETQRRPENLTAAFPEAAINLYHAHYSIKKP